jgi:hypothetical protein
VGTCMISFNRQSRVVVRKRSLEGREGEEEVLFNDKERPSFYPAPDRGRSLVPAPAPAGSVGHDTSTTNRNHELLSE